MRLVVAPDQRRELIAVAAVLALDSAIEKTRAGHRPCSGDRMMVDILRGLIGDDKVAELAKARSSGTEPVLKPRTPSLVAKEKPKSTGLIGLFRLR